MSLTTNALSSPIRSQNLPPVWLRAAGLHWQEPHWGSAASKTCSPRIRWPWPGNPRCCQRNARPAPGRAAGRPTCRRSPRRRGCRAQCPRPRPRPSGKAWALTGIMDNRHKTRPVDSQRHQRLLPHSTLMKRVLLNNIFRIEWRLRLRQALFLRVP
jgi:hypothetical protein